MGKTSDAVSHDNAFDVLIVGAGPAGLNAALILGRARRTVALCDGGDPRNAPATEMHGFVTRDGYSPQILSAAGRKELGRYPSVEIIDCVVETVARDAAFSARLANGRMLTAQRVILATGMRDELPAIEGIEERWGRSVFVCPHCDGWEFADRRMSIAGASNDVIGLAQELYRWSKSLTLLGIAPEQLDDDRRNWLAATRLDAVAATARALQGQNGSLTAIVLSDGSTVECDVLFLCVPLVQRSRLPEALGCELDREGAVIIDQQHQTTAAGVYACGDMVTSVHQVVVAAGSGAKAAIAVNDSLLDDEIERTVRQASTHPAPTSL